MKCGCSRSFDITSHVQSTVSVRLSCKELVILRRANSYVTHGVRLARPPGGGAYIYNIKLHYMSCFHYRRNDNWP